MATLSERPDYLCLSCVCQTYAWGKVGMESEVARLKKSAEGEDFVVGEKQTYAEVKFPLDTPTFDIQLLSEDVIHLLLPLTS